ncbi:MAG: hypothetical protein LBG08_07245 [Spirochaetaceae bacterium]|jgi:hypothetical protein|nr:hypothetical protein [Spirochaetaceae bacterium]
MFLSHSSVRKRFLVKNVLPVLVLCLVMGSALFSSCDWSGGEGRFSLIGIWTDPRQTAEDTYTITNTTLSYGSPYGGDFSGIVISIEYFDNSSGVIIFRYDTGLPSTGRTFGAVYYKGLTATRMEMANAGRWESTPPYKEITPIITSAEQAKKEFTQDNVGNYVTMWGGPYVKQ